MTLAFLSSYARPWNHCALKTVKQSVQWINQEDLPSIEPKSDYFRLNLFAGLNEIKRKIKWKWFSASEWSVVFHCTTPTEVWWINSLICTRETSKSDRPSTRTTINAVGRFRACIGASESGISRIEKNIAHSNEWKITKNDCTKVKELINSSVQQQSRKAK